MRQVQPKDIPETGQRYDMVLTAIGVADTSSDDPKLIVKAVIDNGEYKGKTVSNVFRGDYSESWRQFYRAVGIYPGNKDSMRDFFFPFKQELKIARFSAIVNVLQEEERDKTVFRYSLEAFDTPNEEAELELVRKQTRFNRG